MAILQFTLPVPEFFFLPRPFTNSTFIEARVAANKKPNGRYLVIVILLLAVIFSLALSLSVKSVVKQIKDDEGKKESSAAPSHAGP